MTTEKRIYPRFQPKGVLAKITIAQPAPIKEIVAEGEVIDLSYKGIKIRLSKPLQSEMNHCTLNINVILPQASTPISLHGIINHIRKQCEYGLQFTDADSQQNVDDLMFECIKLANKSIQV